jgi:hypothetical protein
MMNWLVGEFDARPLQKAGMLTKEQLLAFFMRSREQFDKQEFKQLLSVGASTRGPAASEEIINGMQKQIFEALGVQVNHAMHVGLPTNCGRRPPCRVAKSPGPAVWCCRVQQPGALSCKHGSASCVHLGLATVSDTTR